MHARNEQPGDWHIELRGGAFDGWRGLTPKDPAPILIAWKCGRHCGGHATFAANDPAIVLRTAESYRRVEVDAEARTAVYEVGDSGPGLETEERELVGAGSGLGDSWPVTALSGASGEPRRPRA